MEKKKKDHSQRNLIRMGGYSKDQMKQHEKAASKQGVKPSEIPGVITAGASQGFKGKVSAHGSSAADKDSGQQGGLSGEFSAMGQGISQHLATLPKKEKKAKFGSKHSAAERATASNNKEKAKTKRDTDKHRQWHAKNPAEECAQCGIIGPI